MLWIVLLLLGSPAPAAPVPVIDGRIDEAEWSGAVVHELVLGEGAKHPATEPARVRLLRRGDFLYVAVQGSRPGLASLCSAKGPLVRILHASAATAEARFERAGEGWKKTADFEWQLRDSPRAGGSPGQRQYEQMLERSGWTANPDAEGSAGREFQIRASDVDALGVTFLTTSDPMVVAYWPATVADDCRSMRVAQGFLPDSAAFDPTQWHQVGAK